MLPADAAPGPTIIAAHILLPVLSAFRGVCCETFTIMLSVFDNQCQPMLAEWTSERGLCDSISVHQSESLPWTIDSLQMFGESR